MRATDTKQVAATPTEEPAMIRRTTFRRIAAGHYRNDETGVEIVKVPAQRLGRHGHRVAGWSVTAPSLSDGHLSRIDVGFDVTLAAAKEAAAVIIDKTCAQIARDYVAATASYLARLGVDAQDNANDEGWEESESLRSAAWNAHWSGNHDQARAFAREAHAVAFAPRPTIGKTQDSALDDRAYTHPAYDAARPTNSNTASMLIALRAVINDDHEAAIQEHLGRWGKMPHTDDPAELADRTDTIRTAYRQGRLAQDTALHRLTAELGVTPVGAAAILQADPAKSINELADELMPRHS